MVRPLLPARTGLRLCRCKSVPVKNGIYLFGKIRHTDWLPVRPIDEHDKDQTDRGAESMSDDDSEAEDVAMERRERWLRRQAEGRDGSGTDSDDSGSAGSYLSDDDLDAYNQRLVEYDMPLAPYHGPVTTPIQDC